MHENTRYVVSEKISTAKPNYGIVCTDCGSKPTVDIVNPDGSIEHTELCGVCCFGDADCADPENW